MKADTRLMTLLATGLLIYMFSGCVVSPRPVVVRPAPPAPRVEVIPRKPSPRHVWVPGEYRWRKNHYVWVPGHYRRVR